MTATQRTWSDPAARSGESEGASFAGSLLFHALLFGAIVGGSLAFRHHGQSWGQHDMAAGAIQATMVSSLPLPPRQKSLDTGVLTSEKPSPAPTPTKERTEPPPSPKDIAILKKDLPKPAKVADRPLPEPIKHPQPVRPDPTKATSGETAGIRIAQATMQLKNGTASISVEDRAFGARFAYYVNIVNRKVAQNWFTQEADPRASQGKRVTIVFDIDRSGIPSNIRVEDASGSPSLDQSAKRAVQRVQDEGFGPLPAGDHIRVDYAFDYRQQ